MDQFIAQVIENGKGIVAHLDKSSASQEAAKIKRDAAESERLHILRTLTSALVEFMDHARKK